VTGYGGTVDVAFLMCHTNFAFEYLTVSGFFSGVLAFFSVLHVDTPIWLQYCVLLGLNTKVSSFPLILNFTIQLRHQWLLLQYLRMVSLGAGVSDDRYPFQVPRNPSVQGNSLFEPVRAVGDMA
jgi:hypothetical protein